VIALAPLLVLWMGYGAPPKIVICALISFFPMAVTAREGLRATDPQLLLLMRSVGARATDVFWRVRVPAAAPYLAAGLRTGITLSLVGAVVAEWTGADSGLGYLVLSANARLATAQAFAAVLLITLLGLTAYGVAVFVERRVCWWSPSAGAALEAPQTLIPPAKGRT
jgi:ABC-type nitrate/sulfonate/bicarbonate transport system permease component